MIAARIIDTRWVGARLVHKEHDDSCLSSSQDTPMHVLGVHHDSRKATVFDSIYDSAPLFDRQRDDQCCMSVIYSFAAFSHVVSEFV